MNADYSRLFTCHIFLDFQDPMLGNHDSCYYKIPPL